MALPPEKRAAIIKSIKAGGKTARQIAHQYGVAHSTISRIATEEGISSAFDRSQTEKATAAKAADCRARREALKEQLLDDAERLRARAWAPYKVVVSTSTGAQVVDLELPPLQDVRAAYAAVSIAIDKSLRLEQYDTDTSGSSAVDEWLRGMLGETR